MTEAQAGQRWHTKEFLPAQHGTEEGSRCDRCDRQGFRYCVDCRLLLCIHHNTSHDSLLPNHKKMAEGNSTKEKVEYCLEHYRREATRICAKCHKLACLDCVQTDDTECITLVSVEPTERNFRPVNGSDSMMKNGVSISINTKHYCITAMSEYRKKSIEEVRWEHLLEHGAGNFRPVNGSDSMKKNGVTISINTKCYCITAMPEYSNKSIEELRWEHLLEHGAGRREQTRTPFVLVPNKNEKIHDYKAIDSEAWFIRQSMKRKLHQILPMKDLIAVQEKGVKRRMIILQDKSKAEEAGFDRELEQQIILLRKEAEKRKAEMRRHVKTQREVVEDYLAKLKNLDETLDLTENDSREVLEMNGDAYMIRNRRNIVTTLDEALNTPLPDLELSVLSAQVMAPWISLNRKPM